MAGQRTTFGDLTFDAVLIGTTMTEAEITEHPVEKGANPADHIRKKAGTVTLEVIFTNVMLGADDPDGRGESAPNNGGGYARQQLEKLEAMVGDAFTLVLPWWRKLENMAIKSISNPVNKDIDGFKVRVEFKQIRFVNSNTVAFARKVPTAIDKKPTGKEKQGKKAPEPVRRSSSGFDALTKTVGMGLKKTGHTFETP